MQAVPAPDATPESGSPYASLPRSAIDPQDVRWPIAGAEERRVLVVEDNEEHRYVYTRLLRRAGYQVDEAATGAEALRMARQAPPDLAVIDLMLPDTDGWKVTSALKEEPTTRGMPIVVVTVRAFPGDHARSKALGVTRHLNKPASPLEVLSVVNELLGLGGSGTPADRRPGAEG
jgi:CheY-like chemotaxis protein